MFYTYRQNNSGGDFCFEPQAGISHYVIIEADSPENADKLAEGIGLYFDGCYTGRDCPCCGDRWSTQWEEGTVVPQVYSQEVFASNDDNANVYIHYKDGRVVQARYKSEFGDWSDFNLSGKGS
jgi:hypothetical protein